MFQQFVVYTSSADFRIREDRIDFLLCLDGIQKMPDLAEQFFSKFAGFFFRKFGADCMSGLVAWVFFIFNVVPAHRVFISDFF